MLYIMQVTHQPEELDERLLVVLPLGLELRGGRVLVAAQLERDLEVVGGEVVEVLHPAGHGVPRRAVRDPALPREALQAVGISDYPLVQPNYEMLFLGNWTLTAKMGDVISCDDSLRHVLLRLLS